MPSVEVRFLPGFFGIVTKLSDAAQASGTGSFRHWLPAAKDSCLWKGDNGPSETTPATIPDTMPRRLAGPVQAFLALEGLGYAGYDRARIDLFREQVALRGLGPVDIDAAGLAELQDAVPKPRSSGARRNRRFCLARFTNHLVTAGVLDAPAVEPSPLPGRLEQLCADYGDWLRLERGLSRSTACACRQFFRRFLVFLFGDEPGDLNRIGPENVRAFLALPSAVPRRGQGLDKKATDLRRMFRVRHDPPRPCCACEDRGPERMAHRATFRRGGSVWSPP